MKRRRLDDILLQLGYVSESELRRALKRQQRDGGRIGSHLVEAGVLTEQQLGNALAVQFGVAPYKVGEQKVDTDLARRVPRELVESGQVLPAQFDPSNGVLDLVVVAPPNRTAVDSVRKIIRCAGVRLFVVPEITFAALVASHLPAQERLARHFRAIELPDLFEEKDAHAVPPAEGEDGELAQALLISDQAVIRNFLHPIFVREGWKLLSAATSEETAAQLAKGTCRKILVPSRLAGHLKTWIARGEVPPPRCEIVEFPSVSGALLDNPAPYAAMHASLVQALRLGVEARASADEPVPAYELMQADARNLARALELGRLATDGLQLAVLLLVPDPAASDGVAWDRTLSDARVLGFPWDLAAVLEAARELLGERVNLNEFGSKERELALAAQALAVVWFHHGAQRREPLRDEADAQAARSALRSRSGRLARSEVIESYLRLLERDEDDVLAAAGHQIFVVGHDGHDLARLTARLRLLGYPVVPLNEFDEAAKLCLRCAPAAVFVHESVGAERLFACRTVLTGEPQPRLYALTGPSDPSRILHLLDLGFDDVFALPRDLDLVAARLRKSLRADGEEMTETASGGFGGPLNALPFTDLLQVLSRSLKTSRIELAGPGGAVATLYLDRGRLVHATGAGADGAETVYGVINWQDQGRFTVVPVDACPEPNVTAPVESILMEGCRLLDERLAQKT